MSKLEIGKCKIMEVRKEATNTEGVPYKVYRATEAYKKNGKWMYNNYNCITMGDDAKKIEVGNYVKLYGNFMCSANTSNGKTYYNWTLFTMQKYKETDINGVILLDKDSEKKTDDIKDEELPFD